MFLVSEDVELRNIGILTHSDFALYLLRHCLSLDLPSPPNAFPHPKISFGVSTTDGQSRKHPYSVHVHPFFVGIVSDPRDAMPSACSTECKIL
ncbi:Uncharacterized protein HZ326_2195 [Fusarium oxysporum f. sp. albedinis]|nr:Uncharacterized protein HZ326_2195 [Fusarium oxysporum f. sp. albedinis]